MATYTIEGELKLRVQQCEEEYAEDIAKIMNKTLLRTYNLFKNMEEKHGNTVAEGAMTTLIPHALAIYVHEMYGEDSATIFAEATIAASALEENNREKEH